MDRREIISIVVERTGIDPDDCEKVLGTFEEVISEEITRNKWKSIVFELVYGILTHIKNRKESMRGSIL